MLKMSFYNGTMNRAELKDIINGTDKEIRYTYGYTWKNPTTYRKPISKAEALKIIDTQSYLDADDTHGYIHLNAFSENDMY